MAWYTAPSGATCTHAYDAVGAASLADSYVNEAAPGTNDAVQGVAPTWAYGTGWTANGSARLHAPVSISALPTSVIVRATYTATQPSGDFVGVYTGGSGVEYEIRREDSGPRVYYAIGNTNTTRVTSSGIFTGGEVFALTSTGYYRNGALGASITPTWSAGTPTQLGIMCRRRQDTTTYDQILNGATVQAVAIYSGTLTLADVVAITAAMNALPAASSAVAKILQAHGAYMGAGIGY